LARCSAILRSEATRRFDRKGGIKLLSICLKSFVFATLSEDPEGVRLTDELLRERAGNCDLCLVVLSYSPLLQRIVWYPCGGG